MQLVPCDNPRPGRRVASYARFSSHNQRSESIEIQEDNNLAYCAINDLDMVAMLSNGKTVAEIVRALEGHKTKRGKPITHNVLTKMLKRKQNAGVYSYAGHETEGGMPALWTMEEQRMIWKMLGDETRPRRKALGADFLLTGKLYCGKCDTPMTGTSGTGKSGTVYYYYKDKKGCGRQVRKDVIEENVADAVRAALSREATREKIADLVCEYSETEDPTPQSDVIAAEIKEIKAAYANILKAIEQGIIPPGAKERIAQLQEQEETLAEELRIAQAIEAVALDRDRVLFWLEQIAAAPDDKTLIDVFVARVVLLDDDLHIVMHFEDNDGPPGAQLYDKGGGVLPRGTMLHHGGISRTPWFGYYVAWRTLVIVTRYKKTPS